MPESTTANPGSVNRDSWTDDITLLEPQQTPYTSMASKTSEAIGLNLETFTDRLEPASTASGREGGATGQGGNQMARIKRHGAFQHFKQRQWAVTHHQQIVSQRGGLAGVANAADRSKAHAELELKRDMEAINCSNLDTQDGAGGSADMRTRGCHKWLDTAALGTAGSIGYVDPTVQATANSIILHGNTVAPLFSESQLYGMLKELATIRGQSESFEGFFGATVVETLDLFSRIASPTVTVNPGTAVFYTTRQDDREHTLELMVNVYKTSFGIVNSHFTVWNQIDAAGVGDMNAGLVLDMDLWRLDMLENVNEAETFKRATTEGGTWQATWINLCDQPRGNGRIAQT